jgi:hypothetical protein
MSKTDKVDIQKDVGKTSMGWVRGWQAKGGPQGLPIPRSGSLGNWEQKDQGHEGNGTLGREEGWR